MKKKTLIVSALFLTLTLVAIISLLRSTPTNTESGERAEKATSAGIVLYYGIGCPFCEQVDTYIEEEGIAEQISFERKEVYYNRENANELSSAAAVCGLPTNKIGVPFLRDGEECFVGMPDIVNFFDQKVSANDNE